MKKKILPVFIVTVIFFALLPSMVSPERFTPEQLRQHYNATSIELTHGVTHYEEKGTGDTAILFISGFSIPHYIWDKQFDAFASQNWRTIRYNHYGRGFSDYPQDHYRRDHFTEQAIELLDSLRVKNVILIGHSFGAVIASEIAIKQPDRVVSIALVDPMLDKISNNPGATIARLPVIGHYLNRLLVGGGVEKRANTLLSQAGVPHESHYRELLEIERATKGFHHSIECIFEGDALENYREGYKKLAKTEIPVLILHGEPETITPNDNIRVIEQALPQALKLKFNGAGHLVHFECPEIVNRALLSFLESNSDSALQNPDQMPIKSSM